MQIASSINSNPECYRFTHRRQVRDQSPHMYDRRASRANEENRIGRQVLALLFSNRALDARAITLGETTQVSRTSYFDSDFVESVKQVKTEVTLRNTERI